jgi:hypothetical protein
LDFGFWILDFGFWIKRLTPTRSHNPQSKIGNPKSKMMTEFEKQLRQTLPAWHAMELRLMFQRSRERGFTPAAADVAELTRLFGRSPRPYEDFVRESAAAWARGELVLPD